MSTANETFEYGEVDMSEVEKEHANDSRGRLPIFKLHEGRNTLRFLPPAKGRTKPWEIFWVHGVGEGPSFRSFQCPEKMLGEPCPFCARVSDLYRTGNPIDKKAANKMRAKQEAYANVVDMQNPDKGVQVLKLAEGTYRDVRGLMVGDPKSGEDGKNFTHPDTGMNVFITREGTGEHTKYKSIGLSPNGAKPIVNRAWLGQLHDLTSAVRALDAEQVVALLEGGGAQRQLTADDGPPVDRAPTRSVADDPDLQ
jgi:hypothetical protein